MRINNLELTDFRNYNHFFIEFDQGINILIGGNAQGKTNIIEAIYLLSVCKSFRTHINDQMIRFDHDFAKVKGNVFSNERMHQLELILSKESKKAKVDGKDILKISDYVGYLNAVVFVPDDLSLVKGSPSIRRKFLDLELCSLLQQSTEDIPEESYAEQISKTNGDKPVSTYVPFRNGLFLSSAASIALSKDCEVIYYGAHADDSAGFAYPDCSPVFNQAMNEAIWEGSGHQLKIEAPFVNVSKAEVVRIGLELGVPYELTWSCYEGGEKPCGKCGTCIDRAAAFQANHMEDPALR